MQNELNENLMEFSASDVDNLGQLSFSVEEFGGSGSGTVFPFKIEDHGDDTATLALNTTLDFEEQRLWRLQIVVKVS